MIINGYGQLKVSRMKDKNFPPSDIEIKEKSINNNRVVKVIPINKKEEDKKRADIYKQILNRKIE